MRIALPYGKDGKLDVEVPEANLKAVLEPPNKPGVADEAGAVRDAVTNPIGTGRLSEIAAGRASAAIAVSDASRPNIEILALPVIVEELGKAGIPEEKITVIIGTGSHRPATEDELEWKLGDLRHRVRVVNHDSRKSPLFDYGKTPAGFPVKVNREFAEAEVKVAVGTVLPHPIAGFSGGGKAVAVGLSSSETISSIHTPDTLDDPRTGLGKTDGNPFLQFGYDVADMVGIDFLVNAVFNNSGQVVDVVAGAVKEAHGEIIDRCARGNFGASFSEAADIVIVSVGYPKDGNFYHICAEGICVVAGTALPDPVVKPGGTIIVASPMDEGIYNENIFRTLISGPPGEVARRLKSGGVSKPGEHRAYAVASILTGHEVIFAGTKLDPVVTRMVHMRHEDSVESAIRYALVKHGEDASLIVVKDSHRIIPFKEGLRGISP